MTQQKYRTQLEDQVKDLITQYLETHGEAPAVKVEWGNKGNAIHPTIPISERIKRDIEFDDANGRSDPDERSWGMQNGILISKREAQLFVDLLSAQKNTLTSAAPEPEVVEQLRQSYNKGVLDGRKFQKEDENQTTAAPEVRYEIDFGGHIKTRISIRGNKLFIEGCMNGYGDGLSADQIVITEID